MKIILALFVLSVFSIQSILAQKPHSVSLTIQNGKIEGFNDQKEHVDKFLGIPYAQPPVGDLRWKAPQPLEKWKGTKEVKKFGATPVQTDVFGDIVFRSEEMSEDCLYLNVWAPEDRKKNDALPVLVYFYGGGYVAGGSSEPRYDGASMAQKGIVVITVNYRLNLFGFFAHPELSAEASYKASGNYGLLDQAAALQWVKDNIKAFGGDPDKVTIAGESAGSISVSSQMASPLSRHLIAGAIGESGAAINPTLSPVSLKEAETIGMEFATKAGYKSLKELRNASTDEIFEKYKKSGLFGFPSVIDGYFFPKTLPEIFNAGEQAQVPLLLGWNSAEIPGIAFMQGQPYTEEAYIKNVKQAYPTDYEEVLKLYPHTSKEEIELSATALASDRFISYSTWKWFDLHRKNSDQPVYRYLFSQIRPKGPNEKQAPIGAPHASEIPYCMGNLRLMDDFKWTEDDKKTSEVMQQFFANFIKTGDPNNGSVPQWPAAEAEDGTPPVMIINAESQVEEAQNDARYEFLDRAYGND
ncbi:carboxylesterase/lipase family protein [Fulvivirga sediminis]|uniref:Carboxylic ester hydrolase n=1 Tax=Fulvivirga sediminis TaxID=2803949 RepID=A0A937F7W3_9BACT|nr:carboxylesterase family protein [Fulvivirga sediminis]MBL3655935.1 carboxylesterase family protein [Fulvivirga sediminis]